MRIVFEIAGDKQIDREILRVGAHASDAAPAFAAIANLWIDETRLQFQSEGRHASGGWQPLAPSTLARRRRLQRSVGLTDQAGRFVVFSTQGVSGGSVKILDDTGRLKRSLTERGSEDMILDISPSELRYGTKVPYAPYHQRGTERMPRRRPVEFTEGTRRDTVKLLQRFILTGEVAR